MEWSFLRITVLPAGFYARARAHASLAGQKTGHPRGRETPYRRQPSQRPCTPLDHVGDHAKQNHQLNRKVADDQAQEQVVYALSKKENKSFSQ